MSFRPLDQFEFHHHLAETPGTALVIFTTPACGACRCLKQLFAEHRGEFSDLTLFEVDAERDLALTREFDVFHLPALFLYRDGRFHCELQAEAHPRRLREAIDAAVAAPAEEAP